MQSGTETRWTAERAWAWYRAQPWLCGFNYVPSSAINTTEMWQRETFDLGTIDRELGWADEIGFNTCRIFLQYLVWEADRARLIERIEQFLQLADQHHLSTMLCLFDDCAFSGKQPYLGPQDQPRPGVHNSGRLLQPETMALMQTFVSGKGQYNMPALEYGLGVMRNRLPVGTGPSGKARPAEVTTVMGHIGGFGGFRSAVWFAPASGITFALGVNQGATDPNKLATRVFDAILTHQGR